MARFAVALVFALAAAVSPLQGVEAQTVKSIEDAPGYRTVPEPESTAPGATIGSPEAFTGSETDPNATGADPATGDPFGSGTLSIEPSTQRVSPEAFAQDRLEAFARAAVQVQTIAQLWQAVIDDAISAAEALNLRQQANAEKIRAIQELGEISPQAYARINAAARTDAALKARIEALYQEAARAEAAPGPEAGS